MRCTKAKTDPQNNPNAGGNVVPADPQNNLGGDGGGGNQPASPNNRNDGDPLDDDGYYTANEGDPE